MRAKSTIKWEKREEREEREEKLVPSMDQTQIGELIDDKAYIKERDKELSADLAALVQQWRLIYQGFDPRKIDAPSDQDVKKTLADIAKFDDHEVMLLIENYAIHESVYCYLLRGAYGVLKRTNEQKRLSRPSPWSPQLLRDSAEESLKSWKESRGGRNRTTGLDHQLALDLCRYWQSSKEAKPTFWGVRKEPSPFMVWAIDIFHRVGRPLADYREILRLAIKEHNHHHASL